MERVLRETRTEVLYAIQMNVSLQTIKHFNLCNHSGRLGIGEENLTNKHYFCDILIKTAVIKVLQNVSLHDDVCGLSMKCTFV